MATQDHTASAAEILEPSPMAQMRRRVFGHYGIIIGGAVLAIIFAIAIFAPLLTPFDPILDQDLAQKLKPPFWHDSPKYDPAHPLGTDLQGRDYLTRLVHGARISLLIGFSAMIISGVIGTALIAGYFITTLH